MLFVTVVKATVRAPSKSLMIIFPSDDPIRVGIMLFVTVVTVTLISPSTSLMILFPSDVSGHFFITF